MKSRIIELVLVVMAAALFAWGVARAVNRGDSAAKAWTTYAMSGLIVMAGVNIGLRSSNVATAVLVVSALFLLLALSAAILGLVRQNAHSIAGVLRSVIFLSLLVVIGCLQRRLKF